MFQRGTSKTTFPMLRDCAAGGGRRHTTGLTLCMHSILGNDSIPVRSGVIHTEVVCSTECQLVPIEALVI